ncbi:hypothetical protein [Persicobacter diffluens]|uniref:Uncharacterized protein n=1 Tax=Persicobacter diffluens TaxID=981 RepID=A0AAN4VV34_9BACT|nr:hypothetical protein PEDI_04990 [Persicobacter diffluens]
MKNKRLSLFQLFFHLLFIALFMFSIAACRDNQECFDENNAFVVGTFLVTEAGRETAVGASVDSLFAITESEEGRRKIYYNEFSETTGELLPFDMGVPFRLELSPLTTKTTYYLFQKGYGTQLDFTYKTTPQFLSENCGVSFIYNNLEMIQDEQSQQVLPNGQTVNDELKNNQTNILFTLECEQVKDNNDFIKVELLGSDGNPGVEFDSIYTFRPLFNDTLVIAGTGARVSLDLPVVIPAEDQEAFQQTYYFKRGAADFAEPDSIVIQVNAQRYFAANGCGPGVTFTELDVTEQSKITIISDITIGNENKNLRGSEFNFNIQFNTNITEQ